MGEASRWTSPHYITRVSSVTVLRKFLSGRGHSLNRAPCTNSVSRHHDQPTAVENQTQSEVTYQTRGRILITQARCIFLSARKKSAYQRIYFQVQAIRGSDRQTLYVAKAIRLANRVLLISRWLVCILRYRVVMAASWSAALAQRQLL